MTSYERDAIRPHAMGKFKDLLASTAKSPAMLFYLDNWQSVDPAAFERMQKEIEARRREFQVFLGMRYPLNLGPPYPPNPAQTQEVQRLAVASYQAVSCEGMARVDFLMEAATRKFFINEINTIPGFTAISMYPKMWEASGLPYPKLIDRLIELALERHRARQATRFTR